MEIYNRTSIWAFYFIQLLVSLYVYKKTDKVKVSVLLLQAISVAMYFGVRESGVGTDTLNYVNAFLLNDQGLDFGLAILNSLITFIFGKNVTIYLFLINLMFNLNIVLIALNVFEDKKHINFAYLSVTLMPYVVLMNVNIIRQGLSISYLILGLIWITQKSNWKGYFLLLIGVLLHYSMSILVLVFFLIRVAKLNSIAIILVFLFLMAFNLSGLSLSLVNLIPFDYIRIRFIHYLSMKSGVSFLLKLAFYFANFYVFRMFTVLNESKANRFMLDLYGSIILSAAILINSELSSSRVLINAEMLIPIFLFTQINAIKERKVYLIILLLFFFIYFFVFTLSGAYTTNFLLKR